MRSLEDIKSDNAEGAKRQPPAKLFANLDQSISAPMVPADEERVASPIPDDGSAGDP